MKVTALIPDDIIQRIKKTTGGKNITDSLMIALNEYLEQKEITYLSNDLEREPLQFEEAFTAYNVRKVNRKR